MSNVEIVVILPQCIPPQVRTYKMDAPVCAPARDCVIPPGHGHQTAQRGVMHVATE